MSANESLFFEAWFEGVRITGWRWFGDGQPDTEAKQSKWDFAPRCDDIEEAIGWLSSTEAAFLAAMVSFYNARTGGQMMKRLSVNGLADIAAALDAPRRAVISDLIVAYPGW